MSRVSAPRSAADLSARSSRWSEPEKRGLVVSMTVVEMPARRTGPGARSGLRESGCGWCGAFARRDVDEYAAALDLDGERWHAILFKSRLAHAGEAMELPTVPRTSDVIAIEAAFAERPTDVVADIRHRAELSILERDRNGDSSRLTTLQRRPRELIGTADVDPVLSTNHGVPPMLAFVFKCGAKLLVFARKRLSLRDGAPYF